MKNRNVPLTPPSTVESTIDVEPLLLWVKSRGYTRRYLIAKVKEDPYYGNHSFDYMAAHGFGSGDLSSLVPVEYRFQPVEIRPVLNGDPDRYSEALTYIATKMNAVRDGFYGFYTEDGRTFFEVVPVEEGSDIYQRPEIDWYYYTILGGTRELAYTHVKALNRRHIWFDSKAKQDEILEQYAHLIDIM